MVGRIAGVALLYAAMVLAWVGVGLFLLMAPARFGNLLHENLQLFPQVNRDDRIKKLFLRLVGLGLLAFAGRFVLRIVPVLS